MIRNIALSVFALTLALSFATAHAHEHHAPHKGTLIEFGEEFAHLELVIDAKTGKVAGYVLDGHADKAVRVAQKEIVINVTTSDKNAAFSFTLKAQASVLSGEKEGDTSEFSAQNDALKGLSVFDAVVTSITVKGKSFENTKFNFPKGNE
ncbi:MAG: hypothetical protein WCT04_09130 [Planctomycetota bacterium]